MENQDPNLTPTGLSAHQCTDSLSLGPHAGLLKLHATHLAPSILFITCSKSMPRVRDARKLVLGDIRDTGSGREDPLLQLTRLLRLLPRETAL